MYIDMIRLTAEQAAKIGDLRITWWYGIRPIEVKDGSFILNKEVLPDIEKLGIDIKINVSEIAIEKTYVPVLDVLRELPIVKLLPAELKEPIEIEPIIKR